MSQSELLEKVFHQCFFARELTRLQGEAAEPYYQPWSQSADGIAVVWYRADYEASALHEIAHWCIAGRARRRLMDYGYWYEGDGRDQAAQRRFLQVEARPQALESLFHQAWGSTFHCSLDNLNGDHGDEQAFAKAVSQERQALLNHGLPPRAARFIQALRNRRQQEEC
ncbi:MAG: ATPase [Planctomycetota bacterium]|nr:MAG: ATPase [Planctomycetota bacterium]